MYEWYQDNNITDVGYEDEEQMYDQDMNYIGNGPNGYKELWQLIANVVNDLRKSDLVGNVLKNMPVLILDHNYSRYITDFIATANLNNKADEFLYYYSSNINDL